MKRSSRRPFAGTISWAIALVISALASAACGGSPDRSNARGTLVVHALERSPAADGIRIEPGQGMITIRAGDYRWVLSTTAFDVIHSGSARGGERLGPGRATIEALGRVMVFGPPSEVSTGIDWVELRGWANRDAHLWYVARYQFFGYQPYARLVLSLVDRHDTSPATDPSAPYWKNRLLSHWRLEVGAPSGTPTSVTQHNSFSYSSPGRPWVEVLSVSGAPYQWAFGGPSDTPRPQLAHAANDGANQVVWHPMYDGEANIAAVITPFTGGSAYLAATRAVYDVVDASGQTHSKVVAQDRGVLSLGTFVLNASSVVKLRATGGAGQIALAGPLRISPVMSRSAQSFEIPVSERHNGSLSDGFATVAVKDFWQHHPISMIRTVNTIGWDAIQRPALYTGGMGLTLETMFSMDGPAEAVVEALYAPPPRDLGTATFAIDGSLAQTRIGRRYDALVALFGERLDRSLESLDNFGWRNWGDYQIGVSYTARDGPVEEWANEQYDLPYGLLLAWLRMGKPMLWRFAQASVRHLMDVDLVKFSPFGDKLNGLVYRKGEMLRDRSHVAAEPITDQGFAFRSLLLYHHLTGERWALDLAKQNIDRLVYYATSRPDFVLHGGRPTAWMLRAALAGAEQLPGDSQPRYQQVADRIVAQLTAFYDRNGRLPGDQPVWQGQVIEGLAQYHHRTKRADVAQVIVGSVRQLLQDAVRRRADGRYEFRTCLVASADCPPWTDEDNYLFLWLSSIAYASQLSHDPLFAQWGDALFAYGEARMREHTDIRSWTSLLAFPHLFVDLSRASD